MIKEEWKDIKGFEGKYAISNHGRVYSYLNDIYLKPQKNTHGYVAVSLYKEKSKRQELVHRLVGKHFLKNKNEYPQIDHIDGVRDNNLVSNLQWVNQSLNEKSKLLRLPQIRKYKKEDLVLIMQDYESNMPVKDICEKYNTNRGFLNNLFKGKYYSHLQLPVISTKRRDSFSQEEVFKILNLRKSGFSYGEIAKVTKRGKTSIARVIKNKENI